MSADPYVMPALHQGHDLDCQSWAVAGACGITSPERVALSARFILVEGRRQRQTLDGSFGGMGLKPVVSALHRIGICAADLCPADWPNDKQPDVAAYADAERRIGWWELEAISGSDVDEALARPNTVVLISHFIDASWPAAKAGDVLTVPPSSESAHAGVLCSAGPGGTYLYLASAGPGWADRGTCLVHNSIAGHSEERWRVTYVGQ